MEQFRVADVLRYEHRGIEIARVGLTPTEIGHIFGGALLLSTWEGFLSLPWPPPEPEEEEEEPRNGVADSGGFTDPENEPYGALGDGYASAAFATGKEGEAETADLL